jgi:methyl-accepting chemotaxis protein
MRNASPQELRAIRTLLTDTPSLGGLRLSVTTGRGSPYRTGEQGHQVDGQARAGARAAAGLGLCRRHVRRGLGKAISRAADDLAANAQAQARSTYLQLFLAGGLGLLAIIASVLFSVVIGRGLIRQLAGLRQSALDLANNRLPDAMASLRRGDDVDMSAEVPALEPGPDGIGQVRQAFDAVQRTAIEAAAEQARLRVSDVFRNLARRSQSLLHGQLALLDAVERRERA